MSLVFISEIWSPYISTQVQGKTEMKRNSLAECKREKMKKWTCSTFALVSLDSSSNEELPGWTANKDIREKKISLYTLALYIHLSSYLSLLLFPPCFITLCLHSFSFICLSLLARTALLPPLADRPGWKQRTSGSRTVWERERISMWNQTSTKHC